MLAPCNTAYIIAHPLFLFTHSTAHPATHRLLGRLVRPMATSCALVVVLLCAVGVPKDGWSCRDLATDFNGICFCSRSRSAPLLMLRSSGVLIFACALAASAGSRPVPMTEKQLALQRFMHNMTAGDPETWVNKSHAHCCKLQYVRPNCGALTASRAIRHAKQRFDTPWRSLATQQLP